MPAFRVGDEFDLDVGGSMIRGVVRGLFGRNDRQERLWTVEIDGINPGWPVPERAMKIRRSAPQRHRAPLAIADE